MPITLYQDHEVEVYTRMLARAYEMIRDEPASELARDYILKEIEKVLGWKGPPPAKARPDDHWSDCAVNNGPALPVGECDCGGLKLKPHDGSEHDRQTARTPKRETDTAPRQERSGLLERSDDRACDASPTAAADQGCDRIPPDASRR